MPYPGQPSAPSQIVYPGGMFAAALEPSEVYGTAADREFGGKAANCGMADASGSGFGGTAS